MSICLCVQGPCAQEELSDSSQSSHDVVPLGNSTKDKNTLLNRNLPTLAEWERKTKERNAGRAGDRVTSHNGSSENIHKTQESFLEGALERACFLLTVFVYTDSG